MNSRTRDFFLVNNTHSQGVTPILTAFTENDDEKSV